MQPSDPRWLHLLSTIVPLLTPLGVFVAALSLWPRFMSEARLRESTKVEIDARLSALVSDLMNVADGRAATQISEAMAGAVLASARVREALDRGDLADSRNTVSRYAALPVAPGAASQRAAISSLFLLADKHPLLRRSVLQGLESIWYFHADGSRTHDFVRNDISAGFRLFYGGWVAQSRDRQLMEIAMAAEILALPS